jgi:hypothetical protein
MKRREGELLPIANIATPEKRRELGVTTPPRQGRDYDREKQQGRLRYVDRVVSINEEFFASFSSGLPYRCLTFRIRSCPKPLRGKFQLLYDSLESCLVAY